MFNPRDIVSEDNEGYFVKHGDHLHYVYKKDVAHLMPKNETPMVPKPTNPTKVDDKKAAEIAAKVDYIVTVYGVPKEAIKVRDEYFVFNDPSHAYDPTHIHPYVIAIDKLRIPERSEDPEIDFENELFAVAEHTGIDEQIAQIKEQQTKIESLKNDIETLKNIGNSFSGTAVAVGNHHFDTVNGTYRGRLFGPNAEEAAGFVIFDEKEDSTTFSTVKQ